MGTVHGYGRYGTWVPYMCTVRCMGTVHGYMGQCQHSNVPAPA